MGGQSSYGAALGSDTAKVAVENVSSQYCRGYGPKAAEGQAREAASRCQYSLSSGDPDLFSNVVFWSG